jgi:hypothetical protein
VPRAVRVWGAVQAALAISAGFEPARCRFRQVWPALPLWRYCDARNVRGLRNQHFSLELAFVDFLP